MGCFCEKLARGSVRHMEVVYFDPGKRLRLTGALGPLQSMAATGNLGIDLSPAPEGTQPEATYAVVGYLPTGINTWCRSNFSRLKRVIHGANPVSKVQVE